MEEITDEQEEILLEWFVDSMELDALIDFYTENMHNIYKQNPDALMEDWDREYEDMKAAGVVK